MGSRLRSGCFGATRVYGPLSYTASVSGRLRVFGEEREDVGHAARDHAAVSRRPATSMYWYGMFSVFMTSTHVRDRVTGTAVSMSP